MTVVDVLIALRSRVAELVRSRSATDPTAGDPLRGLLLSAEAAGFLATRTSLTSRYALPTASAGDRMTTLVKEFGLAELDVHLLMIALAPDVDRSFEPLYGYLNDDVSRRRATVALALELAGLAPNDPAARGRFHVAAPLVAGALLEVEEPERPLPGRALRVPERIVGFLLGADSIDESLNRAAWLVPHVAATAFAAEVFQQNPTTRLHVRGELAPATNLGRPTLRFDPAMAPAGVVPALIREARLRGAGLIVGPLPEQPADLIRALSGAEVPLVTFGAAWDSRWSTAVHPVRVDAMPLPAGDLFAHASALAAYEKKALSETHHLAAARQRSDSQLHRHARRVVPAVGWADLVLPEEPTELLRELAVRARQREKVLGDWQLLRGGGRGRGVVGLFAGDSGTGKTLAAEVLAASLGVELYVVDLAAIVDKYIGETEKNLERVFTEADRTDAVLLFDEADAIFGKRSEVRDARDRYANLESAYLLQRLETFTGVAILTTNLRANIDDAFTRRLDLVIDFPFPGPPERALLWRRVLAGAPQSPDLDAALDGIAERFELGGGSIRAAAVTAAYRATASSAAVITAADVEAGARREYAKRGHLVVD
ncbi:ATP-binding protein [Winogradskya humida]|uniref:ATPase AAA n=1 Tax=Winogradskya humida TaxID=113566 RepID=A0ABQ3ZP49_9ACTN|nr:ATP-binding protein [Actinoplanes humidus]GIE20322.1 ATPase AAA [Actinoplanes humidus]